MASVARPAPQPGRADECRFIARFRPSRTCFPHDPAFGPSAPHRPHAACGSHVRRRSAAVGNAGHAGTLRQGCTAHAEDRLGHAWPAYSRSLSCRCGFRPCRRAFPGGLAQSSGGFVDCRGQWRGDRPGILLIVALFPAASATGIGRRGTCRWNACGGHRLYPCMAHEADTDLSHPDRHFRFRPLRRIPCSYSVMQTRFTDNPIVLAHQQDFTGPTGPRCRYCFPRFLPVSSVRCWWRRKLELLSLGDITARSLGAAIAPVRLAAGATGVTVAAICVSPDRACRLCRPAGAASGAVFMRPFPARRSCPFRCWSVRFFSGSPILLPARHCAGGTARRLRHCADRRPLSIYLIRRSMRTSAIRTDSFISIPVSIISIWHGALRGICRPVFSICASLRSVRNWPRKG